MITTHVIEGEPWFYVGLRGVGNFEMLMDFGLN